MGKIYARQIPPEHQESPLYTICQSRDGKLDLSDEWPGISLTGNRRYNGYKTGAMEDAERATTDAAEEWSNARENGEHTRIIDVLDLYEIYKHNGKRWTPRELGQWKRLFEDYGSNPYDGRNADRRTVDALELITGKRYAETTLRGCVQGEWISCYYPVDDYTHKDLDRLEMEYFNTGEEWHVFDDDPDDGDPQEDFTMYVYSYKDDEKRQEIAAAAGWGTPEEVELHKFSGWTQLPKWA